MGGPFVPIDYDEKYDGFFDSFRNIEWVISGRAALYKVLIEVRNSTDLHDVWMPAFYCDALVNLVYNLGFNVHFFNVSATNSGIDIALNDISKGIVIFMRYYGFSEYPGCILNILDNPNIVIIEDITHSLLCKNINLEIDYHFASVRKWIGVRTGGFILRRNSNTYLCKSIRENQEIKKKYDSFIMQYKRYMETGEGNRDYYRDCFWECEKEYEKSLSGFDICLDDRKRINNWDRNYTIKKRKENAEYIVSNISPRSLLVYSDIKIKDVPLFVPILLHDTEQRNMLCSFMDKQNIFCDMPWNILSGCSDYCNIIERGFGLVCDERYSTNSMKRMIDLINKWIKEND